MRKKWQYVVSKECELEQYYTSPDIILGLYQLMKDFHEVLAKDNVPYWIGCGTLLGAIRNGGIIKFDDDLDVHILHEDEIRFQNLIPEFEKLGYVVPNKYYYSICQRDKSICMDIFVCHTTKDNKVIYTNRVARTKYPNGHFYLTEIFPLKKYKLGEVEVYGPQDPYPYLHRGYPEWEQYAILSQKHSGLRIEGIDRVKFLLTKDLLKPAEPMGPLKNRVLILS